MDKRNLIPKIDSIEDLPEETSLEFADMIAQELSSPMAMGRFVANVLKNAQDGDAGSLKLIKEALDNIKFKQEKKNLVTDEQLKSIILFAADRLRAESGA